MRRELGLVARELVWLDKADMTARKIRMKEKPRVGYIAQREGGMAAASLKSIIATGAKNPYPRVYHHYHIVYCSHVYISFSCDEGVRRFSMFKSIKCMFFILANGAILRTK